MRKTINVEKLTRGDIDTNRLQEVALLLVKTLYNRAQNDLSETMERSHTSDAAEAIDRKRRDDLKAVYDLLKEIPLRTEQW